MMNSVLFVCTMNMLRSPTAEHVARLCGLSADSAGIDSLAVRVLTSDMIDRAQKIVCFEHKHVNRILELSSERSSDILFWDIPDNYDYCDEKLVKQLKELINAHLVRT